RRLAAPRCRWRIGVARRTRVEQTDHTELDGLAKRGLASNVWVGIVLGTLNRVTLVRVLAGLLPHRPFFALGAGSGATLFVIGVLFGNLLRLLFLLLTLCGSVEVLLDQEQLVV